MHAGVRRLTPQLITDFSIENPSARFPTRGKRRHNLDDRAAPRLDTAIRSRDAPEN